LTTYANKIEKGIFLLKSKSNEGVSKFGLKPNCYCFEIKDIIQNN